MGEVPFYRSIPAGNSVPDPFMRDIPSGNGMDIVQKFGTKPGLIDMDVSQNNYHNPGSEWTITEKVSIAEWGGGVDYEKYLSPGDLVFLGAPKEQALSSIRNEEYPLLNLQSTNDVLQRIWRSTSMRVAPYVGRAGAALRVEKDDLDEPDAPEYGKAARDDAARVGRYEVFLRLPEVNMREMFKSSADSGMGLKDAGYLFTWLSIGGITDQLRPYGVIMNTPEASYDPMSIRARTKPNDQKLVKNMVSVGLSGTVDMYNYWPGAEHLDYLFLVIRRRFNSNTNKEEGWEVQMVYRKEKHLSPYSQMYMGMSALPERAAVYYVGQLIRFLPGDKPKLESEPFINNRAGGTVEASVNAMRGNGKIRVMLAPLVRRT